MAMYNLHLGCGTRHLDGYVNIDKYNEGADRVMDAGDLDYPDGSVKKIYTSHMVEHVSQQEFRKMLKEWQRVLKSGGRLVIRCPNHELYVKMWADGDDKWRYGPGLTTLLGMQNRGPGYVNRNLLSTRRLQHLVTEAGFRIVFCIVYPTRDGKIYNGDILLEAYK